MLMLGKEEVTLPDPPKLEWEVIGDMTFAAKFGGGAYIGCVAWLMLLEGDESLTLCSQSNRGSEPCSLQEGA